MTVHGKIADIRDKKTVVINKGSEDGVEESMKFMIYREGDNIEDPDTGEDMGTVEIPIARIKPLHVMEDMTLMQSDEKKVTDTSPFAFLNQKKTVQQDLPVDGNVENNSSSRGIQIGDLVKSV